MSGSAVALFVSSDQDNDLLAMVFIPIRQIDTFIKNHYMRRVSCCRNVSYLCAVAPR